MEQDTESTNASLEGADAPQGRRRLAEHQFRWNNPTSSQSVYGSRQSGRTTPTYKVTNILVTFPTIPFSKSVAR